MKGILKAYAATGLKQKQFARETGIDERMLSKYCNDVCNPMPDEFRRICDRSGLPPEAIATVSDVDYGVIPISKPPKRQAPENRKNPCRIQCRVSPKEDIAIRKLAMRRGVTVNDLLCEIIRAAIKTDKERRKCQ